MYIWTIGNSPSAAVEQGVHGCASLPETGRFEAQAAVRSTSSVLLDTLQPLVSLLRMYPGRFLAIGSVILLLNFAENAAGFFGPKYFQDAHGWTPGQFAMLGFFGRGYRDLREHDRGQLV